MRPGADGPARLDTHRGCHPFGRMTGRGLPELAGPAIAFAMERTRHRSRAGALGGAVGAALLARARKPVESAAQANN